ncbi:MAG: acetyl-CoA carboxylase biotin carboxyl carrier protein [Clostridia bacterium]|nr:acetyl-CoA carboxylase biotin carboxyl carrier protein [Clostridia bacterium]
MKIEEIKELMSHMQATGLTNFEYEGQGVVIKMGREQTCVVAASPEMKMAPAAVQNVSAAPVMTAPASVEVEAAKAMGETVKSPIVGVFYEASGPDKPAFVSVGSMVKKGDVLCIVEAMKVMNEIVAEKNCKIIKVLCSNEDIVEYGQPLFEIEAV